MSGVGGLLGVTGGAGGISPQTSASAGDATSPFTGDTSFNFGAGSGSTATGAASAGGAGGISPALILGGVAVVGLFALVLLKK